MSHRHVLSFALALAAVALVHTGTALAQPAEERSKWNASPEPLALYGHCGDNSSMAAKLAALTYVGESVEGVLAIKILSCKHYTSGSGSFVKQACPAGSPYDFCIGTPNDGMGNAVEMGTLRVSPKTDPNAPYQGCPPGADVQPKIDLVRPAGIDPRTLIGIVTISCSAARAGAPAPAAEVLPCPEGRLPYSECIGTQNDGHGNSVVLGLLRYRGTGDPDGLYGECDQQIQPGFSSKRSVLPLVGRTTDNVRGIDMLSCAVPWGYGPGFPAGLHTGSCVGATWVNQALARRYDYCIWGTDARNAGIVMGVNAH